MRSFETKTSGLLQVSLTDETAFLLLYGGMQVAASHRYDRSTLLFRRYRLRQGCRKRLIYKYAERRFEGVRALRNGIGRKKNYILFIAALATTNYSF